MSYTTKDECKHCKARISPELMQLHIRYAHPEKHTTKVKKITQTITDAHKSKVKGYINADGTVECVLCHNLINYSEQEAHMQNKHKASLQQYINYLRAPRAQNNRWVTFCQGGGPGLGKKH